MSIRTVAVLFAICLFNSRPAYAYIDPGTGGMLLQLVTGGVAGLLLLVRLYWRRVKDTLTGKSAGSGSDRS